MLVSCGTGENRTGRRLQTPRADEAAVLDEAAGVDRWQMPF